MREQILEYDPTYLLYGGGVSFVMNIVLFRIVSPMLSVFSSVTYSTINKAQQGEWNDRFISNVNAMLSIALSGYSLLLEPGNIQDKVWYDSPPSRLACGVVVGYMIADIICMLLWCKMSRKELIGFIFHHAATVYAYYFISAYGVLCYFGMLRLIAEMSTCSVNQRWYFDVMGYSRSNFIVVVNGFLMVLTFFVFRMLVMPVYWYQIWQVSGTEAVQRIGHIQLIMYIPCAVLDALNIYWFYKMCRGFAKALKGLNEETADTGKMKTV